MPEFIGKQPIAADSVKNHHTEESNHSPYLYAIAYGMDAPSLFEGIRDPIILEIMDKSIQSLRAQIAQGETE